MTIFGFILGLVIMAVGFMMVYRTDWFIRNLGDLGAAFGAFNMRWLSWKMAGTILLLVGFMVAFGLFTLFIKLIFGRFARFGQL